MKADYDGMGHPLHAYDAYGQLVTTNTYDATGDLTGTTDALGNRTIFAYNPSGTLASTTDALGHVTQYGYDQAGDVTGVTDASGHATTFTYDGDGNKATQQTTRTNALTGRTETLLTQFFYDPDGHLIRTIAPDGSASQTVYDSLGKVDHTVDAAGLVTGYVYDALGNLTQTVAPGGFTTSTTYDAGGNRQTTTDPLGRVTGDEYDSLGRLVASGPAASTAIGNPTAFLPAGTINWLTDGGSAPIHSSTTFDDDGDALTGTDEDGHTIATRDVVPATADPCRHTLHGHAGRALRGAQGEWQAWISKHHSARR